MARPVRTDLKTTLNEVGQVASIQQRSCTSGLIPHIRAAELFADHEDSGGEPKILQDGRGNIDDCAVSVIECQANETGGCPASMCLHEFAHRHTAQAPPR